MLWIDVGETYRKGDADGRLCNIELNKWQSSRKNFTLQKNLPVIRGVGGGILLTGGPRRFSTLLCTDGPH